MRYVDKSILRSRHVARVGAGLLLAVVILTLVAVWRLRGDAIDQANEETHRVAEMIGEQTTRALQAVDVVLQGLAQQVLRLQVTDADGLRREFGTRELNDALARRLVDLPQAEAFSIVDAEGRSINTTRTWPPPNGFLLNDRSYFRHFADSDATGAYISEPMNNRLDGRQTVLLTRRLQSADGRFLGVVTAPIRLEYFAQFFEAVGFGNGTLVTIVRRDGTILLRFPDRGGNLPEKFPAGAPWYDALAAGGGAFRSTGAIDDLGPRIVHMKLLTPYPLAITVARLESAALAIWHREAAYIGVGLLAITLCVSILLFVLSRQLGILNAWETRMRTQAVSLKASEAHLSDQSALLQMTLEHMNQGLIMVDGDGIVAVCNQRAIELLELPAEMMTARPRFSDVGAYQLSNGEFNNMPSGPPDTAGTDILPIHEAIYERRRPNGVVLEIRTRPLPTGGMVRTYTDVTARAAAEEMLSLAAAHDQLTGLANRNGFSARLEAALVAAQRANRRVVVLCLDLDSFKQVNDTLGHEVGDMLLTAAARRMREALRETDILARMGGDEFAVVLVGSADSDAEAIAQRLLETVRQPYEIGGTQARVGVSIGIATYPIDGATAEQLLRNADIALYQAKAAGRNAWRVYASEDGLRERKRRELESDLRAAVEQAQFSLMYQPICDAATQLPIAFEALVRWHHPVRGQVPPSEFIPVAEQAGLIVPLGRWVMETAFAEAATWPLPLRIAVNLSPAQFRERDLLGFVDDVIARTGLDARRLELEVTEGLLLEQTDQVIGIMKALRARGVRMVLDDFGTANSNLSYLRGFPFDQVKIDRSFMRALNSDRQARALVEAMLAMAQALSLEVVGEGVETREQLAMLRHLRCDNVQGFLLGRPMSAEATRALVRKLAGAAGAPDRRVAV